MRVNKRADWYRALDANDKQYGVAKIAIADQRRLLRYLERYSHRLPDGADQIFNNMGLYDAYEQLRLTVSFYQTYPKYYTEHVVAAGVLEPPPGLGGGAHTTKEILERLKGAPIPRNYAFAVGEGANGNWSRAIAMLREKIGLSPEGGYDLLAAERLYQYGKNKWRNGRGYLYSDNNPEVLFDRNYREYVTVVNSEVWMLAGLDINYLHDNDYEIWKVIEPGAPMYDLSGRTTSKEPDNGKLIKTLGRAFNSSLNLDRQNRIDRARAGLEPSIEPDSLSNGLQKEVWAAGAEAGYGLLSTELTWYLLTHSLSPHPEPVVIEEGISYLFDGFIEEIKKMPSFNDKVKEFLKDKESSFSQEKMGVVSFPWKQSLDLFLAIHDCTVWVEGEKNEDGTWNLHFYMADTYDFDYKDTEGMGIFDKISWKINNAAHFSQLDGAITPFPIEFRFTIENYAVSDDEVE